MEMENEAESGSFVPLISSSQGDEEETSSAGQNTASLTVDERPLVDGKGASPHLTDPTEHGKVTALSLAMIIFYNASGEFIIVCDLFLFVSTMYLFTKLMSNGRR